jgi:ribonuclease HII
MIYSALWWPVAYAEELGQLGFNDSKKLQPIDR